MNHQRYSSLIDAPNDDLNRSEAKSFHSDDFEGNLIFLRQNTRKTTRKILKSMNSDNYTHDGSTLQNFKADDNRIKYSGEDKKSSKSYLNNSLFEEDPLYIPNEIMSLKSMSQKMDNIRTIIDERQYLTDPMPEDLCDLFNFSFNKPNSCFIKDLNLS